MLHLMESFSGNIYLIQIVKLKHSLTRSFAYTWWEKIREGREKERIERKIGNLPVVQDLGPAGLSFNI